MASVMGRGGVTAVTFVVGLLMLLTFAGTATAATEAPASQQRAMLAAAVSSPGGKSVGLRVNRKGRATMKPLGSRGPAKIVAVRSSIDRSWGLLVALLNGRADVRRTFLFHRSSDRWRVQWSANRGEEADAVCANRRPGTAVILDLGLSSNAWGGKCRYKRERRGLVRRMSAGEVASVRRMVEWKWGADGQMRPGPRQPAVHDVFASDCAWDGRGRLVPRPVGEVAKSNPRWGLLSVTCVIGSDGFGLIESTTVMLVRRSGRSGPFTRVLAHTHPAWSQRGTLCSRHKRWPIPALPRVALEFCTPFPSLLRGALY